MFEFSVIRKYLIPRRRRLSVALIGLMSTMVISLVVWLLLVFLSITDGIERGWTHKLTSLNAPLKITPTEAYYASYYYLIDTLSTQSNFSSKSIGQKRLSPSSDPYDPLTDPSIPSHWPLADQNPDGTLKDPVKSAFTILASFQKRDPSFYFQEFEVGGAMLRLKLVRERTQNFLTQVSYIASFSGEVPYVSSLISSPTKDDINHLLNSDLSSLKNSAVKKVRTPSSWDIPLHFLPEGTTFEGYALIKEGQISQLVLPDQMNQADPKGFIKGSVRRDKENLFFNETPVWNPKVKALDSLSFASHLIEESIQQSRKISDLQLQLKGKLQGKSISGITAWKDLEIEEVSPQTSFQSPPLASPPWCFQLGLKTILPSLPTKEHGILVAQSMREGGVKIGDRGYLAYQAATAASLQEQRIPVYVAGFYDPGIMSMGSKCILVPPSVARTINASSHMQHFDKTVSNGIQIWCSDIKQARHLKAELASAFEKAGIAPYWKISTYHEYDFAKDLLQQFQSDRTLFTLIGGIILIVACCNIISLLVIIVGDKKKEIGILQAMGASRLSIALIFGGLGCMIGLISVFIGTGAALLTLHYLDPILSFLSSLQGQPLFNAAFYGHTLSSDLSSHALIFIAIATPLLSLLGGVIPAVQACRLRPSEILRSE